MPVSHKRKSLKHKAKKSSKNSHRNHRNKKTKKSLKNMRGGVIKSDPKFEDIEIGDKFIRTYNSIFPDKIMEITGIDSYNYMTTPNITVREVGTKNIVAMQFSEFKNLFARKIYVPFIRNPQSLSSLAATKVKKMFYPDNIENLREEGVIDQNTYTKLME